jgi:nicotinamidase/pyrazinamidase
MKALLVVDVQNDFCPGGALGTPEGDKVVPVINKIMDKFDLVLASRDWHPEDSVHFNQWPPHCVRNTKGAEYHPDLNTNKFSQELFKGTGNKDDGYSAFETTNINLVDFLKEKKVDELYISGLTTEYCVKQTTLDALKHQFNTYLVVDGIEGVRANPEDPQKAIDEMKEKGAKLIGADEIR